MASSSTALVIQLKGDNKDLRRAFTDSENRGKTFAKRIGRIASQAAAGIAVGAGALGAVSVKQASDLEESANAVRVTFGKEADEIAKMAENAARGVGLSASEFNGMAVQFSSFAEDIAGAGGDVSDVVGDISTRAADFASVMNLDVADAARIFQSGLAGETEPLKKFGINLSAAAVEAHAVATGIIDAGDKMTETEKIQARYSLLMEETAKTQGDFANTSDSLANQQRILGATAKNLAAKLGASLLPILSRLAAVIADKLVPWLERNLPKAIDAVKQAIEQATPVVRGIFEAFRSVFEFFKNNQPALIGLIAAIAVGLGAWAVSAGLAAAATLLAIAPFIAAAAAIGAVVAGLVYAYQEWDTFRAVVDAVRAWMVDTLWPAIQTVAEGIVVAFEAVVAWTEQNWPKIRAVIEAVIGAVKATIETTVAVIRAIWETWGNTLVSFIRDKWESIKKLVQAAIDIVRGIIQTVTSLIKGDWQGAWDGIKLILSGAWDGIKATVQTAIDTVRTILQLGWDLIGDAVTGAWDAIKGAISGAFDSIVGFARELPGRMMNAIGDMSRWGVDLVIAIAEGIVSSAWRITNAIKNAVPSPGSLVSGVTGGIRGAVGKIPGFASGVQNFAGGLAVVGEAGPELLRLPRGSDVIPIGQSSSSTVVGSGVGGGVTLNIQPGAIVIQGGTANDGDQVIDAFAAWIRRNGPRSINKMLGTA